MTRYLVLGMLVGTLAASAGVEAQLGGLLKKKAGEVLGKKPAPPAPAPAPAPETPATEAAPAAPGADAKPPAASAPAATAARKEGSALEIDALPVQQSADQVLRDRISTRSNGDWDQLPYIPAAARAAAYGLAVPAQVTLVETVGGALKSLVMSDAFIAKHDAYVKDEFKGVNHGLKGVMTMEQVVKKGDLKAMEAMQQRMMIGMQVEMALTLPADHLKAQLASELDDWKKKAADVKRRDRATFQKLVTLAQPLEAMPAGDEKFRRGYAVVKSVENEGPDTEAAVFAMYERNKQEQEQAAYDEHSVKAQLRKHLAAFVAIASTVNFDAPTVEKGKTTVFTNPADERQGALWKACFRAGPEPTAAAVKLAKAWLGEL